MTVIECEGAPRDLGWDQGRACASALRAGVATLGARGWWRVAGHRDRRETARLLREIRRHHPHQAEQLEGMARGAGLSVSRVGRAMLVALEGDRQAGSIALLRGGAPLLARPLDGDALVRRARPEGRFRTLEFTRAPLTTTLIGVNEAGLAVTCDPGPRGVARCAAAPAALLARDCLERFSRVSAALEWCLSRPAQPSALILLADADGAAVGVKIAHDARRVLRAESELLMMHAAPGAVADFSKWRDEIDRKGPALTTALGAGAAPGGTPFALADPIARRIRPPGREACWIDF